MKICIKVTEKSLKILKHKGLKIKLFSCRHLVIMSVKNKLNESLLVNRLLLCNLILDILFPKQLFTGSIKDFWMIKC